MKKPKVGQKLFFVLGRKKGECIVTKVGRKYFYIKFNGLECKISIDTWKQIDSYNRVFITEKHFHDEQERLKRGNILGRIFRYRTPDNISLEQIKKAMAIMNIDYKEES